MRKGAWSMDASRHTAPVLSKSEPTSVAEWLELDRKYRIKGRYDVSQVLVRGDGVRVWDADGKAYLDFESGQVCASTGHCHPAYTQAIADQAAKLVQTGSGYTAPARVLLAQKLAEIMPAGLERSYFACTGSEATEAALRLAKLSTGRSEIVALTRGYHGMTHGSLSVTGLGGKFKNVPGSGLPGVVHIPAPYAYRNPYRDAPPGDDMAFFQHGLEIIDWTSTGAPAAIILEVIMSVGGMIVPSREYLHAVRRWCDQTGALMIVDEAQTGVGRTGRWFAVEHFGVVPDIITTSKSLGGGIPLSGVTTTHEIADRVQELGYHQSSSHTDDPFLCAVGLVNIRIIEEEGLVQNADEQGRYLKSAFEDMLRRHEIVGDVRGIGLMLGIEIVTDKSTKTPSALHASAISQYCRDNGLLIGHRPTGAVSGNIIRMLPPLILKRDEADQALVILEAAIQHAEKTVSYTPQAGTGWM
jgi:4-aminobutyrate aminotransferase-like enzyme